MTLEEMKAMKLHETDRIPGDDAVYIRRIPNGWMYEYYDFDGDGKLITAVPVYEVLPIIQHIEPRLP